MLASNKDASDLDDLLDMVSWSITYQTVHMPT